MVQVEYACVKCEAIFVLDDDSVPHEDEGEILCSECYTEEHCFYCSWCEEYGEKADLHKYIIVFDDTKVGLALPGLYRVDTHPYYWSGMLEDGVYPSAVTWLGFLPEVERDPDGPARGEFCADCQHRALAAVAHETACGVLAVR